MNSPYRAYTNELPEVREMRHVAMALVLLAFATGAILAAFSLAALVTGMPVEWFKAGFLGIIALAGVVTGGAIVVGLLRGWGQMSGADSFWQKHTGIKTNVERLPLDVPPTLPAPLPARMDEPDRTFQLTSPQKGTRPVPVELVNGFDVRDLEYFSRYLANGGRFTENVMEPIELPYEGVRMGKAEPGTPYYRFMELCTERGIVVDRGPRKPGRLVIFDQREILRRLKERRY